ncbi:hypothetical protein PINS_up016569 [Pythium insidiosum]|nr:hypothetical protein PINS_up016569 [Pythium insidiosum]
MRNGSKSSATTTPPPSSSASPSAAAVSAALTPRDQPPSTSNIVSETPTGPSSSTKKQRSIHDFFSQATKKPAKKNIGEKRPSPESPARDASSELPLGRKKRTLTTNASLENEPVKKRIDYDCLDGEESSEGTQSHDSMLTPKRIDFGGLCPSSQRSEPDVEPAAMNSTTPVARHSVVLSDPYSRSLSQSSGYFGGGNGMFSQDDMDFCTPLDQPVVPLSHPTTPSPIKKRQRRGHNPQFIQEEEVQTITQDMTHMDVAAAKTARVAATVNEALLSPDATMRDGDAAAMDTSALITSSTDSTDMLLATPQRVLGLPSAFLPGRRGLRNESRETEKKPPAAPTAPSALSAESFTNPFAPLPPSDARKRRPQRKRQSFPPSLFGGHSAGVPYSRYLSEFVEQEMIGSGAFSKVFKCVKKIDGWVYAVKKSKRHFRGRADTERALREVQALAALSDSQHIVRYFDAWIEEDILYIQLEHCTGCSLSTLTEKFKPHHVPEETLCRVLCHVAQALHDLHSRKMVHMDVKLQNILVATGEVYKLGDLGTVALADGTMEITEGDNRYLSRELLEGNRSNLKAGDVFALGATVYELALGATLPNGGEDWQKIRDGDLVLFRQYSNSLQHLIASMMHPDPLQRPSAEEILQHEVVLPFRSS